ncbi:MAG: hypothetical protein MI723_00855, partial [Caulobacterales bacterium]|nr:hypothetical protein [Caulobacterales bacterium]
MLAAGCGPDAGPSSPPAEADIFIDIASTRPHAPAGLIPRAELFGPPERFRGRLSPDGQKVSWLAPRNGVLNLWIAPADTPEDARPVTQAPRDIGFYDWLPNNTHLVFSQPVPDGSGWNLHSVDAVTGIARDITPGDADVKADYSAWSWDYPDEIVISANDRDPSAFDLLRVNVVTGDSERFFVNDSQFVKLHVDHGLRLRLAETIAEDGGRVVHRREADDSWRTVDAIPFEDATTTRIIAFDGANQSVFAFDSRGRDSTALVRIDLARWTSSVIAELSGVDMADALLHPTTFEVEAVMVAPLESEWIAFNDRAREALSELRARLPRNSFMHVLARTVDDRRWIVYESGAAHPGRYHIFDVETGVVTPMFDVRPKLARRALAPVTPVTIKT